MSHYCSGYSMSDIQIFPSFENKRAAFTEAKFVLTSNKCHPIFFISKGNLMFINFFYPSEIHADFFSIYNSLGALEFSVFFTVGWIDLDLICSCYSYL